MVVLVVLVVVVVVLVLVVVVIVVVVESSVFFLVDPHDFIIRVYSTKRRNRLPFGLPYKASWEDDETKQSGKTESDSVAYRP